MRSKCFIWSLLVMATLQAVAGTALHLPGNRIPVAEGFSGNRVYCVYQDNTGLLWIGTDNGLYRYDGQTMLNLFQPATEGHTLTGEFISDIEPGADGRLWVQTDKALHVLNTQTGVIKACRTTSCGIKPFSRIAYATDSSVWQVCIASMQLQLINASGISGASKAIVEVSGAEQLRELLTDRSCYYLVSLGSGEVYKKEESGKVSRRFEITQALHSTNRYYGVPYIADNNNGLCVLGLDSGKIVVKENTTKRVEVTSLPWHQPYCSIQHMVFDAAGDCWMAVSGGHASDNGIIKYEASTNRWLANDSITAAWMNPRLHCLLPLKRGLMLMGTDNGLSVLHLSESLFTVFLNQRTANSNDYAISTRRMVQLNDSVLLVSSYKGNYEVNINTGKPKLVAPAYVCFGFAEAGAGNYLCAEENRGIYTYTGRNAAFKKTGAEDSRYRCLVKDSSGNFWAAGVGCLHVMNRNAEVKRMRLAVAGIDSAGLIIKSIVFANGTQAWLGSNQGLLQLNISIGELQPYSYPQGTAPTVLPDINAMAAADSILWLATANGLQSLNLKTGATRLYGVAEGLMNTRIVSIEKDETGNLWMGTFRGLVRFNTRTNTFTTWLFEDGLPHNEFNLGSSLRLIDGRLVFGTLNGIVCFKPTALPTPNDELPQIQVTRLAVYDSRQNAYRTMQTGLDGMHTLEINPYNRFFELDAVLPDYAAPDKHRVFYYLEGLEVDWIDNDYRQTIHYATLPAGNYTLHIKIQNERGQWSKELQLAIVVHDFFYRKTWFWLLVILLVIAVGYLLYRIRLQRLKKWYNLRMKIAADLHDEVGSMLTGIAFRAEMAQMAEEGEKNGALHKIAKDLSYSVAKMRDVIWTVNADNDVAEKLLAQMENLLFEILGPAEINYRFSAIGLNPKAVVRADIRQQLYLLYREALTNIVKHSNATIVEVAIKKEQGCFMLEVKDNGVAVEGRFVKGGNGMANMKRRAEALGGELVVVWDNGCTIRLVAPVLF